MGDSWKLTVAYDGTNFFGSQRQSGRRSVQEELERSLKLLAGGDVASVFAGRTDRGVHAVGQVVSLNAIRPGMSGTAFVDAVNAHLPDDVSVVRAERIVGGLHARYDATWREYRYRVWIGPGQPLSRKMLWVRRSPLDLLAMQDASARFCGTHDVASFASGGEGVPGSERSQRPRGTVRTITHCSVAIVQPDWGITPGTGTAIEIRVVADGFLPRMVRSMVGALVEIGTHRHDPVWIDELLAARDRRVGPGTAPPHGLVLWRVGYGNDVPDPEPGPFGTLTSSADRSITGEQPAPER